MSDQIAAAAARPRNDPAQGSLLVDSGRCMRSLSARNRGSARNAFRNHTLSLMYGIQIDRVAYARSSSRNAASF